MVEPIPSLFADLQRNRPDSRFVLVQAAISTSAAR